MNSSGKHNDVSVRFHGDFRFLLFLFQRRKQNYFQIKQVKFARKLGREKADSMREK